MGSARRSGARPSRQILAAHARVSQDRPHHLAGDSRRARHDRAGGAARCADQGRGGAAGAQSGPGDRGRLDRLDSGDRCADGSGGAAARRRRGAAGARHRSRRGNLAPDRGPLPSLPRKPGRGRVGCAVEARERQASPRRSSAIRNSLCRLCSHVLGIGRDEVLRLAPPAECGREPLASEAFRPAAATDQWRARTGASDFVAHAQAALEGLAVVEAANAEEEALAIALALRETLEHADQTAALVTPDRALARRVLAALARWNVAVDDSGGDPLADTPAGLFARLAAQTTIDGLAPVGLLALLKHPLTRLGAAAGADRHAIAVLERAILRGPRPRPGSAGLARALASLKGELGQAQARRALRPASLRSARRLERARSRGRRRSDRAARGRAGTARKHRARPLFVRRAGGAPPRHHRGALARRRRAGRLRGRGRQCARAKCSTTSRPGCRTPISRSRPAIIPMCSRPPSRTGWCGGPGCRACGCAFSGRSRRGSPAATAWCWAD